MRAQQRRQPVAAVQLCVALGADPQRSRVQHAERRGERALPRVVSSQVPGHPPSCRWQGCRELEHAVELDPVLLEPPGLVVQVLRAASSIPSGGLDVTVGEGTDPHLGPGGRDDERVDAGACRGIHSPAVRPAVGEAPARPEALDARSARFTAAESRHPSEPTESPPPREGLRDRARDA
jgi:hypothetical protein